MSAAAKVWFITGASSGFGRAFAEHALAQGYNVVISARRADKLDELAARTPDRVLAQKLDVTRPQEADAAVQAAMARFGRIDVLINNAGYAVVGAVEETSDAEMRAIMDTNFFGAVAVTRAVLPVLRAQRAGAIVNISSLGGQLSYPGFGAYSASKFALEGLSEALAAEMAPFGVKVLIVEPGAFRTGLVGTAMREMPVMDGYRDVVGGTRDFTRAMNNAQDGDPRKAARAIEQALDAETSPLRLQLGSDSIDAVRAHTETLLRDLGSWEAVGRETKLEHSRPKV